MIYTLIALLIFLIVCYLYNTFSYDQLEKYYSISSDEISKEQEDKEEKEKNIKLTLEQKITFLILSLIIFAILMIFFSLTLTNFIIALVFSISLSYIFIRILANREVKNVYKKYDFYLPIVMERLVMAVQGGNDVYSAVNIVVELSKKNGSLDPVTKLLDMVLKKNRSGISFEDSLALVANSINLTSIRHGFLHLGIAQKEGGEIVAPMEELSDSTQEYYQQLVEKEIAVLPVKATLPLLCAFIGLIIFFLSVPLTQIMTMESMPK
ncbi:MAG: hypothetical protein ACOX3T_02150 [Bdellovibrionota bacterium]